MTADGEALSEGNVNEVKRKEGGGEQTSETAKVAAAASFQWKGGSDRQTTGIWMWSSPFIRKDSETGADIAVLLMDTQGMFDNLTTMTVTAQIFGLSTMVSSFQVLHSNKTVVLL